MAMVDLRLAVVNLYGTLLSLLVKVQIFTVQLFQGTVSLLSLAGAKRAIVGACDFAVVSVARIVGSVASLPRLVINLSRGAYAFTVAPLARVFSYKTVAAVHYILFETHLLQNVACVLLLTAFGHLYLSLPDRSGWTDGNDDDGAKYDADAAAALTTAAAAAARRKTRLALSSGSSGGVFGYLRAALGGGGGGGSLRRRLAASLGRHVEPAGPTAAPAASAEGKAPATPTKGGARAMAAATPLSAASSVRGGGGSGGGGGSVWSVSSPGGLSCHDDEVDEDEDGGSYDDGEEEKEPYGVAVARRQHAFIVKEAAANPAALVGWQIAIRGKGLGLVLGIKRRLGQATLFRVQMDAGNVQLLSLKRSATKGDLPFAPVAKIAD